MVFLSKSVLKNKKISVLGSGSWGTALAGYIATLHQNTILYSNDASIVSSVNNENKNCCYHSDVVLPKNLTATNDINDVINSAILVIATPSAVFSEIINLLKDRNISSDVLLLVATKGISTNPVQLLSDKLSETLPNNFAFIAGPNFANEVLHGCKTSATIASSDIKLANYLSDIFSTDIFSMNPIEDIVTLQISSIVKNIAAIKSGILSAQHGNMCENARAMLIVNVLKEIEIISKKLGGKDVSFIEAGILGDLILTAYSKTSRNTSFGYELHKNNYSKEFISSYKILVEGLESTKLIGKLVDINASDTPMIYSMVKLLDN